jgi:hypothetical protein
MPRATHCGGKASADSVRRRMSKSSDNFGAAKELAELASAATQLESLPDVVGSQVDADAPLLPLSDDEPAAISSLVPPSAREHLLRALRGEPYDMRQLPDTRALIIGIMRVLVATGIKPETLADAVWRA